MRVISLVQYKMEGWDKHERVVEENGVWHKKETNFRLLIQKENSMFFFILTSQ